MSISVDRTKQLIDAGGRSAKALKFLLEKPSEILTTLLVGNNIVNIFIASLTTSVAQDLFPDKAITVAVLFSTTVILIFGEIIPKTFCRNHAEKLAIPMLWVLKALYYSPLYVIVKLFMVIIRLVLGDKAQLNGRLVTQNDIEYMVSKAEKEQSIDSKQIDLLNSILEFPTIKVKDIMTPRSAVIGISIESGYEEIIKMIRDEAHSRYPVFGKDLDEIYGFIHVKDIAFINEENRKSFKITKYTNEAFFVYEHMKIQSVFDHMNRKKVHLSLVKDENGLVVGIITLEDIMEEIFGAIQDEHDDDEEVENDSKNVNFDNGITVEGSATLRELDNDFEIEIPLNDNYSTLNGFMLDLLEDAFPKKGHMIYWGHYSFELIDVVDNQINNIKIMKVEEDEKEEIKAEARNVIINEEDKAFVVADNVREFDLN